MNRLNSESTLESGTEIADELQKIVNKLIVRQYSEKARKEERNKTIYAMIEEARKNADVNIEKKKGEVEGIDFHASRPKDYHGPIEPVVESPVVPEPQLFPAASNQSSDYEE